VADATADARRFASAVTASLDRKACNTLNVCCIVRARARVLIPIFLLALQGASLRRHRGCKLHVAEEDIRLIPQSWRGSRVMVRRESGHDYEPAVDTIPTAELGREWDWDETPEVSLKIVDSVDEAIALFNALSPRFSASLISEDEAAQERFYAGVEAAFVGDGMTRWVDGQYALNRPELGLSNWQHGRLLARGGVLSGDSVYTVRTRMRQKDAGLHR
jgi:glutamate-5-semialdehyde dehydrogenase